MLLCLGRQLHAFADMESSIQHDVLRLARDLATEAHAKLVVNALK